MLYSREKKAEYHKNIYHMRRRTKWLCKVWASYHSSPLLLGSLSSSLAPHPLLSLLLPGSPYPSRFSSQGIGSCKTTNQLTNICTSSISNLSSFESGFKLVSDSLRTNFYCWQCTNIFHKVVKLSRSTPQYYNLSKYFSVFHVGLDLVSQDTNSRF